MPDLDTQLQCERTEAQGFHSLMHFISERAKSELEISTTHVAGAPAWSCGAIDWVLFNRTVGLGLFDSLTSDWLSQIGAFYRGGKHAIEASPQARSLDLSELEAGGYAVAMRRPKFVRSSEPREMPAGVSIRTATATDAGLFAQVMVASFGFPKAGLAWAQSVAETPLQGRVCVIAYVDERPVGTGILYCSGGVGWLGGGCCLPEFRGRGVQKALIESRSSMARDLGAKWVTSETNADLPDAPNLSRHNMVRCGFEHVFDRPQCIKGG